MNRARWLRTLRISLLVGLVLPALGCEEPRSTAQRNLVLITLDTTRADAVSSLGGDPRTTPNLDRLAATGALFTRAYSESNVTNPSHVTILTGRRTIDHGVMNNFTPLPANLDTLPLALQREGYATGAFVAVRHLAHFLEWQGFDDFPDVKNALDAARVTDLALEWLGGAEAPFFLWVHYFDPHTLYDPPQEIAKAFYDGDRTAGPGQPIAQHEYFQRTDFDHITRWLGETRDPKWAPAMYAGELHHADRQIGRLLEGLDESNTVVVAVADHGESLGEHGVMYAHKGLYEQNLRIPLIVRVPGFAPARPEAVVSTLDLVPTLSELLGVELEAKPPGLSLVPLLKGEPAADVAARTTHIYEHSGNHVVAVRQENWKLIWAVNPDHPIFTRPPQLFDLDADPQELENLAPQYPERVARMRKPIEPWILLGPVLEDAADLSPEIVQQLRELGYLGGP